MLDHPGAIQVPTGALKWPKTAPKWPRLAQNHQNGSKWHCMTPNDPKTLPMGILHDYMSCWTTLGPFQRPTGGPKMALHDPKWPFNEEPSYPKCPFITQDGQFCTTPPNLLSVGILLGWPFKTSNVLGSIPTVAIQNPGQPPLPIFLTPFIFSTKNKCSFTSKIYVLGFCWDDHLNHVKHWKSESVV